MADYRVAWIWQCASCWVCVVRQCLFTGVVRSQFSTPPDIAMIPIRGLRKWSSLHCRNSTRLGRPGQEKSRPRWGWCTRPADLRGNLVMYTSELIVVTVEVETGWFLLHLWWNSAAREAASRSLFSNK